MALSHGPRVVTDGLVLALDAADINSFDEYENLLTYSEQFDNAIWQKQNGFSITANTAIAPDGTLTADTASRVNLGSEYLYQTTNASGTYTLSCWVRAVTGTTTFVMSSYNGVDGSIASGTFTATTTWQRFSHTATVTTTNNWYPCVPSVSGAQLYIWGAQLERGSSANSYYPTTGTTKTRGSTWIDLSGNSNNGTLTNGPTYNIDNGGSIVFDGTNDYVNSTSISSQFTSDITAEVWIYVSSYPSDWVRIIGTGGNGGNNRTFGLWYNGGLGGRILWQRYGAVDPSIFPTSPSLSIGTWYHIVATTSGSSHALYLNASSIGTATASGPWAASGENITIGFAGFHTYHNGRMSNVRLYNRALTATEVQQNFNATRSRFNI